MTNVINTIFGILGNAFDSIPVLNKLKGYRSALGFVGMGVIAVLQHLNVGSPEILQAINTGFLVWTGLALNAKGRE